MAEAGDDDLEKMMAERQQLVQQQNRTADEEAEEGYHGWTTLNETRARNGSKWRTQVQGDVKNPTRSRVQVQVLESEADRHTSYWKTQAPTVYESVDGGCGISILSILKKLTPTKPDDPLEGTQVMVENEAALMRAKWLYGSQKRLTELESEIESKFSGSRVRAPRTQAQRRRENEQDQLKRRAAKEFKKAKEQAMARELLLEWMQDNGSQQEARKTEDELIESLLAHMKNPLDHWVTLSTDEERKYVEFTEKVLRLVESIKRLLERELEKAMSESLPGVPWMKGIPIKNEQRRPGRTDRGVMVQYQPMRWRWTIVKKDIPVLMPAPGGELTWVEVPAASLVPYMFSSQLADLESRRFTYANAPASGELKWTALRPSSLRPFLRDSQIAALERLRFTMVHFDYVPALAPFGELRWITLQEAAGCFRPYLGPSQVAALERAIALDVERHYAQGYEARWRRHEKNVLRPLNATHSSVMQVLNLNRIRGRPDEKTRAEKKSREEKKNRLYEKAEKMWRAHIANEDRTISFEPANFGFSIRTKPGPAQEKKRRVTNMAVAALVQGGGDDEDKDEDEDEDEDEDTINNVTMLCVAEQALRAWRAEEDKGECVSTSQGAMEPSRTSD